MRIKKGGRFYFFLAHSLENRTVPFFSSNKSITLVELVISIIIVSIMVLSFYSLETYSHNQVIYSERRAKVQSNLSYVLEHMSKYVHQAQGNLTRPAIEYFPLGSPDGFRVWVDVNQTPWNLGDDPSVRYRLDGSNTITVICPGVPGCTNNEKLSERILNNFVSGSMPNNPSDGFYVLIGDAGSSVEIGLVGRFSPTDPVVSVDPVITVRNPQVEMKTKLICNNCSVQ